MLFDQQTNQFNLGLYNSKMPSILRIADGVVIFICLYFLSIWYNNKFPDFYVHAVFFAVILFFISSTNTKLYESWKLIDSSRVIIRLFATWAITIFGLLILASATKKSEEYSRVVLYTWFIVTPVFLSIWRLILDHNPWIKIKGSNKVRVVLAGWNESSEELIKGIKNKKNLEFDVLGIYDDHDQKVSNIPLANIKYLGDFKALIKDAQSNQFDLVYVNLGINAGHKIEHIAKEFANTTVSLYYIFPQNNLFNLLQPSWHYVSGHHAISIFESPFSGPSTFVKRLEDIIIGSLILLLISIPLIVISIIVKTTSRGPILFNQRRYGLDGKVFYMYKFRSMTVMEDNDIVSQAKKNDSRVTLWGGFMRRHSLDELPQFFNVIFGDMSIVGPRPHAVSHNEEHRINVPGYMLRHKVKPGITGVAQISDLRGEIQTPEQIIQRTKADLYYIKNWSLWLDIKIIFLSIFKGFFSPNAY